MSGHSKWSNIHRKKEANDQVRSGIFTKISALISLAVVKGGGIADPSQNFALRLAIEKAKSANMPKDKIENAIMRATASAGGEGLVELTIEGFLPESVAIIIEVVTNNRNRSVAEIRALLEKNGGRMGDPGSASYLFEKLGMITLDKKLSDQTTLEIIELGVRDIEDGCVWTELDDLHQVSAKLKELGVVTKESKIGYYSKRESLVSVQDEQRLFSFVELISDHPDVMEVYVNVR